MNSENIDYENEVRNGEKNFADLLDLLETAVSKNKLFFSNKSEVLEMINALKKSLPDEMKASYEIVNKEKQIVARAREDAEDIRKTAEREAENIVEEARLQADDLVSLDEITRRAEEQGRKICEQAVDYRDKMYETTNDYVVSVLEQAQEKVNLALESVQSVCDDVERNKQNFIDYTNSRKESEE